MIQLVLIVALVLVISVFGLVFGLKRKTVAGKSKKNIQSLESLLENVTVPHPTETDGAPVVTGLYQGSKVRLELYAQHVEYEVDLPVTGVGYKELLEGFGDDALRQELEKLDIQIALPSGRDHKTPAQAYGSIQGSGNHLRSHLKELEARFKVIKSLADLNQSAPKVLFDRLKTARAAYDIDGILLQLTRHFPHAKETQDALALAKKRDPRAERWIQDRAERWAVDQLG